MCKDGHIYCETWLTAIARYPILSRVPSHSVVGYENSIASGVLRAHIRSKSILLVDIEISRRSEMLGLSSMFRPTTSVTESVLRQVPESYLSPTALQFL